MIFSSGPNAFSRTSRASTASVPNTALAREFQIGNLLDNLLGWVWANLHGITDVLGSVVLVNISNDGVDQQLALITKQRQIGTNSLNKVNDLLLLGSESFEQDFKCINSISAHFTLAREFKWSCLYDLLSLWANINSITDVGGSIILVNVSNNSVNQLLALVTK